MRKYEDPNLLDYRYGGDRLGDFAEKYMRTLAYVFDALNELDATDIDHYLFKLEGNTVYVRDEDGEEWIKFVEISTDGEGNKILLFDGSSPLWGGIAHHLTNLQDGHILVWSEDEHAFVNQNITAKLTNAINNHNNDQHAHPYLQQKINEANNEIQELWGNDLIEKVDNELTLSNGQTHPVRMILTENDEITFGDNEFFTRNLEYDEDGNVMPVA